MAPAAAATPAGVLAVTLTGGPGTASASPPAGDSAVVLLGRIADVAVKPEATLVCDDQLVHV